MSSIRIEPIRLFRILGFQRGEEDVYPLLDWRLTVRLGGWLWLVGAAAGIAVMPVSPPTRMIGAIGWPVALVIAVTGVISGVYLLVRPTAVSHGELLGMGYIGAAALGVGQALIGPGPQWELSFLLLIAYHATVHPSRRVIKLLAWVAVVAVSSVLSSNPTDLQVAQMIAAVLLLVVMTGMTLAHAESRRSAETDLIRLHDAAERLAVTDSLTRLGNRRAFDSAVARNAVVSRRYGRSLSLAMLDIDGFKLINDRFGHAAGDETLVCVAGEISNGLRDADAAFRWGGDEFAILMPETGPAEAERVAARISAAVTRRISVPDGGRTTISYGLATLGPREQVDRFIRLADERLFAAKLAASVAHRRWHRPAEPRVSAGRRRDL